LGFELEANDKFANCERPSRTAGTRPVTTDHRVGRERLELAERRNSQFDRTAFDCSNNLPRGVFGWPSGLVSADRTRAWAGEQAPDFPC
jgi:hypothetical protein